MVVLVRAQQEQVVPAALEYCGHLPVVPMPAAVAAHLIIEAVLEFPVLEEQAVAEQVALKTLRELLV